MYTTPSLKGTNTRSTPNILRENILPSLNSFDVLVFGLWGTFHIKEAFGGAGGAGTFFRAHPRGLDVTCPVRQASQRDF